MPDYQGRPQNWHFDPPEIDSGDMATWERLKGELPDGWEPLTVQRTAYKRALGEIRFRNAIASLEAIDPDTDRIDPTLYYGAGVAAQMGLTAFLLDRGYDDHWCARNVGLRITTALDWANAAGLNHANPSICRLAIVLTPYWKWRRFWHSRFLRGADCGFKPGEVHTIIDNLLDHICTATGFEYTAADGPRREQR